METLSSGPGPSSARESQGFRQECKTQKCKEYLQIQGYMPSRRLRRTTEHQRKIKHCDEDETVNQTATVTEKIAHYTRQFSDSFVSQYSYLIDAVDSDEYTGTVSQIVVDRSEWDFVMQFKKFLFNTATSDSSLCTMKDIEFAKTIDEESGELYDFLLFLKKKCNEPEKTRLDVKYAFLEACIDSAICRAFGIAEEYVEKQEGELCMSSCIFDWHKLPRRMDFKNVEFGELSQKAEGTAEPVKEGTAGCQGSSESTARKRQHDQGSEYNDLKRRYENMVVNRNHYKALSSTLSGSLSEVTGIKSSARYHRGRKETALCPIVLLTDCRRSSPFIDTL